MDEPVAKINMEKLYDGFLGLQNDFRKYMSKNDMQIQAINNEIKSIKDTLNEDDKAEEHRRNFSEKIKIAVISAVVPICLTGIIGLFIYLAKEGVFG